MRLGLENANDGRDREKDREKDCTHFVCPCVCACVSASFMHVCLEESL